MIWAGVEWPGMKELDKGVVGSVHSGLLGLYLKMKARSLGEGLLLRSDRRWPRQGDSGISLGCTKQGVSDISMQSKG